MNTDAQPVRARRYPEPEYEVCWDGVNDDHDGDLIRFGDRMVERVLNKRVGNGKGKRPRVSAILFAALRPCSDLTPLTANEIQLLTALSMQSVTWSLTNMQNKGWIASRPRLILNERRRFMTRGRMMEQEFWLTDEGRKAMTDASHDEATEE